MNIAIDTTGIIGALTTISSYYLWQAIRDLLGAYKPLWKSPIEWLLVLLIGLISGGLLIYLLGLL